MTGTITARMQAHPAPGLRAYVDDPEGNAIGTPVAAGYEMTNVSDINHTFVVTGFSGKVNFLAKAPNGAVLGRWRNVDVPVIEPSDSDVVLDGWNAAVASIIETKIDGIKERTDNLPDLPAAVGDVNVIVNPTTLDSTEREAIAAATRAAIDVSPVAATIDETKINAIVADAATAATQSTAAATDAATAATQTTKANLRTSVGGRWTDEDGKTFDLTIEDTP